MKELMSLGNEEIPMKHRGVARSDLTEGLWMPDLTPDLPCLSSPMEEHLEITPFPL